MNKYEKIFKIVMWALIAVSVAILVWGSFVGFESNSGAPVDTLLRWGYIMVGAALCAVIVVGAIISAMNDAKGLLKAIAAIAGVAAVCFVVYLVSAGDPAVGLTVDQPTESKLKLTDTVLNLTYLAGGLAVVAILFGEVFSAIRNK